MCYGNILSSIIPISWTPGFSEFSIIRTKPNFFLPVKRCNPNPPPPTTPMIRNNLLFSKWFQISKFHCKCSVGKGCSGILATSVCLFRWLILDSVHLYNLYKKTVVYLSLRTCCTCLSLCALIKVFLTLAALTSFDLLNAGSLACFSGVQSRWSGLYKRRCLHLEEQWGKQHFSQLLFQETLALVLVQTLGCIAVQQIKRRRYTAMRKNWIMFGWGIRARRRWCFLGIKRMCFFLGTA